MIDGMFRCYMTGHEQIVKARVIIDATSNSTIMIAAGGTYNVGKRLAFKL